MGLLLALLVAASAWGASFDCARATLPLERAICGDAETSTLDERMAALYRRTQVTPWAEMVRAEQLRWLRERRLPAAADPIRLRDAYRSRIATLEPQAALAGDPSLSGLTEEQIAASCVALPPDPGAEPGLGCRVRQSGPLGTVGGRRLHYAIYLHLPTAEPADSEEGRQTVLVFAAGPDGRFALQLADFRDAVFCAEPVLLARRQGPILQMPCHESGTGNINAEAVFAWRDGAWRALDIQSWTADLARRLPAGLQVWKGVYPDYVGLTARSPLWRPGDGNCCPSGGAARMTFAWQGDRLALRGIRVVRGRAAAEQ